ncbi:MAG: [NiFe]-hydrogenase assembly chaperone HybE [Gammaproteobacteria bacterium]|nr:[NiFe]-hydrogenase assembly chaperone HybE [Gammaproteobacteria bacterium]
MKTIVDPQDAADTLLQTFEHILQENMQGIPILNNKLQVQTLGFQKFEGRIIGIVITPWLMNLIMLPNEDDDWNELELGKKMPIKFPSSSHKFMVNEIDGIGKCKTHSMYSPMHEFSSQDHAVKVAQDFLNGLIVEREPTVEELVDEDLLGRIMRGEEIDVNLDEFAVIEPVTQLSSRATAQETIETDVIPSINENVINSQTTPKMSQAMSRRDLIRGKFLRS